MSLIKLKEKEYFSKDYSLLKSFIKEKIGDKSKSPSKSEFNQSDSVQKSNKVTELLKKTKNKLKLNKKTKAQNWDQRMKAFEGLSSFIDSKKFMHDMNIINGVNKSQSEEQSFHYLRNKISMNTKIFDGIDEYDEEENDEIYEVEGKKTTKLPKINVKRELIDKANLIIKKKKIDNRYRFKSNMGDLYGENPKTIEDKITYHLYNKEKNKLLMPFEEKLIDDFRTGKFMNLFINEEQQFLDQQKFEAELKRFAHFFQNNKKITDRLKNDLNKGIYEEAFKNQAEKVAILLRRAARKIYNQKIDKVDEILEKKNKFHKERVVELSKLKVQSNTEISLSSKDKYSNIHSRFMSGINLQISADNSNSIIKTKSSVKRILSPLFLTEGNSIISRISQEKSRILTPSFDASNIIKKRKNYSLFESIDEGSENPKVHHKLDQIYERKIKIKRENNEMRKKLEFILKDIEEIKSHGMNDRELFFQDMHKIHEKWSQLQSVEKDALQILAKDYTFHSNLNLFNSKARKSVL